MREETDRSTRHVRGFRNLLGSVIADSYLLEEVLSVKYRGGVFRAADRRLQRAVVVKLGELGVHEARNTARLPHHPNVRRVYDYGTDGALRFDFLVLELLHGIALADVRRPVATETAITVLKGISGGLGVLHRMGTVHCDLNPSHIFLQECYRGDDIEDELYVRLIGLGHSAILHDEEFQPTPLPREGDYLAPEQLSGRTVTPATDIYSFGLIGLELVGGAHRRLDSVSEAAVERELERVSRFRREVPNWLLKVLGRCLRDDPSRRYAIGDQLRECIEHRNADLWPERAFTSVVRPNPSATDAAAAPPSWREILQLKPNVWGIGVDLEALWRRWRWNQERKRS